MKKPVGSDQFPVLSQDASFSRLWGAWRNLISMDTKSKVRVVIVGGGFGGLLAALSEVALNAIVGILAGAIVLACVLSVRRFARPSAA